MFDAGNSSLLHYWPLGAAIVFLAVAGAHNVRTMRVPNALSFAAIGAALFVALLSSAGVVPTSGGSLMNSVMGAGLGLMILLPFYVLQIMPAGCVKAHMAFGAWLGSGLAAGPTWQALWIASLSGAVVTAAGLFVQVYARRVAFAPDYSEVTGPQPDALFPLQATMSAGAIVGLVAGFVLGYIV